MKETISKKEIIFAGVTAAAFTAGLLLFFYKVSGAGFPPFTRSMMKDVLFVNISFMGDAVFAFAAVFFLLFFLNLKELSLRLLLTIMVSLTLVQIIKNVLYGGSFHIYFEAGNPGPFPESNLLSSHTALAVSMAGFFLVNIPRNKRANIIFCIAAAAVAYSRIYFGADSFLSLSTAFLPASIAILIASGPASQGKVKRSFRRTRTRMPRTQHWIPA